MRYFLSALVVSGLNSSPVHEIIRPSNQKNAHTITRTSSKNYISFSAIGDWGGVSIPPYQVPWGHGVAHSVNRIAKTYDDDFVLLVGDNFYWDGVKDVNDKRFVQTFENTFSESLGNLKDMKFYMQSGNHDYRGNMTAQIEYTKKQDRWVFPSLWYNIVQETEDFKLEIVYIDTNALGGVGTMAEAAGYPMDREERSAMQMEWFENVMKNSDADYLIVSGHHPIYSIAEHGSQNFMIEKVLPIMKKYGAQVYINGHDHNLQYIQDLEETTGFIVTGCATLPNPSRKHRGDIKEKGGKLKFFWAKPLSSWGGYTHFVADKWGLKVDFIDAGTEKVLYQVSYPRREL